MKRFVALVATASVAVALPTAASARPGAGASGTGSKDGCYIQADPPVKIGALVRTRSWIRCNRTRTSSDVQIRVINDVPNNVDTSHRVEYFGNYSFAAGRWVVLYVDRVCTSAGRKKYNNTYIKLQGWTLGKTVESGNGSDCGHGAFIRRVVQYAS